MKKRMILILILFLLGLVLRFVFQGHDYIAYTLWGIALLLLLFPILPGWGRWMLAILLVIGCAVFVILEIPIVKEAKTDADPKADYVIVLGAGINGMNPSRSLTERLEAALDYLNEYPDSVAIVSGSQGPDEPVPEADVMYDWLIAKGVDPNRVIKEILADNTRQNLENSFAIMAERGADPKDGVAIVTSEYHLYRAKLMAEALGAKPLGVAAKTTWIDLRVNYFIREAFAAAYMRVAGTLY